MEGGCSASLVAAENSISAEKRCNTAKLQHNGNYLIHFDYIENRILFTEAAESNIV